MVWFFVMTTVVFAALSIYLSLKEESKAKKTKAVSDANDQKMHVIVHELRAPVTAIKGAASLLLSKSIGPQEQDKMLHVIFDSSRDMLTDISEILDSAKADAGKLVIRKVKSDLSVITKEHIDVFSYAAAEKGISLSYQPDHISQFDFDPDRIGQVINNLISNSLKFTRTGGKIEVKIEAKGNEIEVCVSDNGVGIPEGKKAVLFTKFGQIDHNQNAVRDGVSREDESSGLGLFISKQIVEAHGGKIWVESQEGVGTKIHFSLPYVMVTQEPVQQVQPQPQIQS